MAISWPLPSPIPCGSLLSVTEESSRAFTFSHHQSGRHLVTRLGARDIPPVVAASPAHHCALPNLHSTRRFYHSPALLMASGSVTVPPGEAAAPVNFIYACSICCYTLSDVYEGHNETVEGLSDGINPKERLVTHLYLASCCHVFCSSHIEGGGEPSPTAPVGRLLTHHSTSFPP
jgi:hypothetical protein